MLLSATKFENPIYQGLCLLIFKVLDHNILTKTSLNVAHQKGNERAVCMSDFLLQFSSGQNGTCGRAVKIGLNSEISVKGPKFRNKPTDAVTIALWLKLDDSKGLHKLFYTLGTYLVLFLRYYNAR